MIPSWVSGVTGAADFVNVFYPEKGRIAFSHDSWGRGGATSRVCSVDVSREHVVEIDHGGLYPDQALVPCTVQGSKADPSNRLRITLDGEVVMDVADHVYPADPGTVRVGENRLGGIKHGTDVLRHHCFGRAFACHSLGDPAGGEYPCLQTGRRRDLGMKNPCFPGILRLA